MLICSIIVFCVNSRTRRGPLVVSQIHPVPLENQEWPTPTATYLPKWGWRLINTCKPLLCSVSKWDFKTCAKHHDSCCVWGSGDEKGKEERDFLSKPPRSWCYLHWVHWIVPVMWCWSFVFFWIVRWPFSWLSLPDWSSPTLWDWRDLTEKESFPCLFIHVKGKSVCYMSDLALDSFLPWLYWMKPHFMLNWPYWSTVVILSRCLIHPDISACSFMCD